MSYLYNTILHQPMLNVLIFFYNNIAFQDLGVAIILFTILMRIVLFPLFQKGVRHQAIMQRLQPQIKKVTEEYKNDKEKKILATMELYREHKINPFSGIFILILQIPIFITLYQIFSNIFKPELLDSLYSFVARPEEIHPYFLGLINLQESNILILGLAALAQYFQGTLSLPKRGTEPMDQSQKMARNMVFIGPVITVVFLYSLPAAIGLFWATGSVFSVIQQIIVNKSLENEQLGGGNKKNS